MTVSNIIFFIVFSIIACSWGWGMRGTIIGGEKGAMLPGALLGTAISLFSGSEFLAENFYILAGMGALSMYCGGNMTYSETLNLSMGSSPAPHIKKGLLALFIKGGIWFGIFGGCISMYISVMSGAYSLLSLILFTICIPISALLFFFLLNKPFNPYRKIFPKIYFSEKKQETWGGLFGILLEIIIFSAIMKDTATLAITGGTILSGGISWVIAQCVQIRCRYPGKKGKIILGDANSNGFVDSWKVMECIFGALAGLGTAVTFILSAPLLSDKFANIDKNGIFEIIPDSASKLIVCIYGVILLADTAQYFIIPVYGKHYYKRLLKMGIINEDSYNSSKSFTKPAESDSMRRYKALCNKSEFAVYSTVPMLLCFFGCYHVASLAAFCVIILVLCQEVCEKCFPSDKSAEFYKVCLFLPVIMLFVTQVVTDSVYPLQMTIIIYTFLYESAFFMLKMFASESVDFSKKEKTVHGYFVICCLVLNILTVIVKNI